MNKIHIFNVFASSLAMYGSPQIEDKPVWAAKTYGKPNSGGNSFASRETSPRFYRTRHGSMKQKKT